MTNYAPEVQVFENKLSASRAAARKSAALIREAIERRGRARLLLATGNSQIDLVDFLVAEPGIPWGKVEVFHLDEYVGIDADHPASFRRWIRRRFVEKVSLGAAWYLEGDSPDLERTLSDYSTAVRAGPIDVAFVGFGENGHIAFNDPHSADFTDPAMFKVVALDETCIAQQVGEGHFGTRSEVPGEAVTVTCTGLLRADHWICCVPELRKADAVKAALEGPVTPACPASLARRHPSVSVYLDVNSASLLAGANRTITVA